METDSSGRIQSPVPLLFSLLLLSLCGVQSVPMPIEAVLNRLDSKKAPPEVQEAAAKGVVRRLLPTHISSFQFNIIPKVVCGGHSCFRMSNYNNSRDNDSPEIMIEGTSAVELTSGFHWYLKYWCQAHVSWDKTGGIQAATVPEPGWLPRIQKDIIMIKRPVPWSYYQNVVTSSYSFVWWDWNRWEKEIDWMALQGVNLPLAFTGQEAVWKKVFKGYDISEQDLNDFFGGPSFLAWARMGNLHGWGGPLSKNWLDQQLILQKKILARMFELGMTPVLPSFSGNVPGIFRKIFPSANISRLSNWNAVNEDLRWCCTFLLDPSDPLFVEVGEAFIKQQIREYGDITDVYNCDTFNENAPPSNDPAYISKLGAAVYKAMSSGNKDAVWLMQGWLFSSDSSFWKPLQMKALLHSVPFGKMVVLDLFADVKPIWKSSFQFYGVPYIWCMLHNFGGNIEMYGVLDEVSSGSIDARISMNSAMVGVGMCMEGIEQNPVVYELMSEMAFRSRKVSVKEWLKDYATRRYGQSLDTIETAWQILYHTIYNCTDGIEDHNRDFIVYFPDSNPSRISYAVLKQKIFTMTTMPRVSFRESNSDIPSPHLWYSTKDVIGALKLFIDAGDKLTGSLTYRYDLVDLTRQVLAKLSNEVFLEVINAYQDSNIETLTLYSSKFIELIEDLDTLLASDDNFLLGTWLEGSKKLASTKKERSQYEWNARTQVTMWFDNTETNQSLLHDYANKYWSGLLKSYYLPRALTYFKYMQSSLKQNKPFDLDGWRREWIAYSNEWQAGKELYPVNYEGDALIISKELVRKYFG